MKSGAEDADLEVELVFEEAPVAEEEEWVVLRGVRGCGGVPGEELNWGGDEIAG